MKIECSKEADAIYVYFKEEFVASSDKWKRGLIYFSIWGCGTIGKTVVLTDRGSIPL